MAKINEWLNADKLEQLTSWAMAGMIDKDIAHNMGIGLSTLNLWKKKHPEIREALAVGKGVADAKVEDALFRAACGDTIKEEYYTRQFNRTTGKTEMVLTKVVEREIPPNVVACIFWLKNRDPDHWRDRPEVPNNEMVDHARAILLEVGSVIK